MLADAISSAIFAVSLTMAAAQTPPARRTRWRAPRSCSRYLDCSRRSALHGPFAGQALDDDGGADAAAFASDKGTLVLQIHDLVLQMGR